MQHHGNSQTNGVLALLRALHARVRQCPTTEISLKMLLPAYERLLRSDASSLDHETRMMHELQRVRTALRSEPDLFDAIQRFDERVERCLQIDNASSVCSMLDALRLLLALAGGEDRRTFVLDDPTRVNSQRQTSVPRLGERIHMGNVDVVTQTQRTLLQSTALRLAEETVVRQYDFTSLTPTGTTEASLWYPEQNITNCEPHIASISVSPPVELDAFLQQFQATNTNVPRLIDIPPLPRRDTPSLLPSVTPTHKIEKRTVKPSPSAVDSEVFFFDASHVIKSLPFESDEEGMTEVSSDGVQSTTPWLASVLQSQPVASWEELGADRLKTAGRPVLRSPTPETYVLRQTVSLSVGCASSMANAVEIDEDDLLEYVVRALCGIESVVFRLDVPTASLRCPRKNVLIKLRTSSQTSLMSILDEFRSAGTAFIRLEFLSVYYAQDPSRGGKSAKALADALQLFLSAYQERICDLSKEVSKTSCYVSLIAMLAKTRSVRKNLQDLLDVLTRSRGPNLGSEYWGLLKGGEFPRGIELINLLHSELLRWEIEDTSGAMTGLVQWLLIRTAAPFVSLLSNYAASGQAPRELDPHDEFQLSVFSTRLALDDVCLASNTWRENLVPRFLEPSVSQLMNIGRLQQMLCSILPHTDTLPLDVFRLGLKVSEAQSQLVCARAMISELSRRVEAACVTDLVHSTPRRPLRSPAKSPRADEDAGGEWTVNKRKRLEQKHNSQPSPRDNLDRQTHEQAIAHTHGDHGEKISLGDTEQPWMTESAVQGQSGKGPFSKYSSHVPDEKSHVIYMKWRRDRANRLSSAKIELMKLYKEDQEDWSTALHDSLLAANFQTQGPPCSTSAFDVTVVDASSGYDGAPQAPRSTNTKEPTQVVEDDGLLWRPRKKALNVPGGGGQDALAALYPKHHEQKDPKRSECIIVDDGVHWKPRIRVQNVPGGGGQHVMSALYPTNNDLKGIKKTVIAADPDGLQWRPQVRIHNVPGGGGQGAMTTLYPSQSHSNENFTSTDDVGDDGLLWRPRIRVQHIPGGGGQDTMAILYPDRALTGAQDASRRNSVAVIQPGHPNGFAPHVATHGGVFDGPAHWNQQNAREDSSTLASDDQPETWVDKSVSIANEELGDDRGNEDVVMSTHDVFDHTPDGAVCHSQLPLRLPADPEVIQTERPALGILQSATCFLRASISPEDASVIHAALHPPTLSTPTASVPFRTLSKIALEDPITLIHESIDRLALQAMVMKLKLRTHLHWLLRILLMSEGLCMTIFTRDMYSELRSEQRVLLALPGRLTTSLALAMIEARTVTSPDQLPSFEYRIEEGFVAAVSTGPSMPSMVEVVQHISLHYNLPDHLGAVVTDRAVSNYQRVHRFLLLVHLTEHEVRHTWLAWRKSTLRDGTQNASTRRACDLALHSTQLLLNAFLETFTHQVLESKWMVFANGIDSADSVSRLREAHITFSDLVCACCLLQDDQLEEVQVFEALIECVWSVGKLIRTAEKQSDSMDPFQSKILDVVSSQATTTRKFATQLYRLESSTNRGVRDFAKHFLLRLNLNGFFADTTVATS